MTTNDSDRTIFRQPMPGGDRTSFRGSGPARTNAPSRSSSNESYLQQPRPQTFSHQREIPAQAISFQFEGGVNPIVAAAEKLITIFSKIKSTPRHNDIASLHQRLTSEIKEFEASLRDANIRQEQLIAARYLMCSVLDESVLNTPWGTDSPWAQRTLLSVFHGETSGGEKSFLLLEKICQSPSENIHLIELFYICISLGFEGRYRFLPRGKDNLSHLRDEIFSIIRRYRGDNERSISLCWQGLRSSKKPITETFPLWFVALVMSVLLFFGYSGMRYWLHTTAEPVLEQIHNMNTSEPKIR